MTEARRLGGFELHEKLGSGAMATVYRGVQLSLGRAVVLKIIHPHLAEDPGLVARFEREARAAAHLRHENIVQVIDCGKIDDTPFIAMEFVQGMDLKRLIETYGVPPLEMTILILRDLCRGLQHAHENGVIHRDIKPANLMITPTGTIKIMDFGLARRAEDSVAMTMAGSVMGTPAYMSPEQATGLKVDERSDIFTVGVVGYELLVGHRPFFGDTYSAVLNAILTQEPEPLRVVLPGAPPDLVNIVHAALAKEPSARPARIADLREVLETLVQRLGLARSEDLLRHYASNPEDVAQRLRNRLPGETVESVLLGTVPRAAPPESLLETRAGGLESLPPTGRTPPPPEATVTGARSQPPEAAGRESIPPQPTIPPREAPPPGESPPPGAAKPDRGGSGRGIAEPRQRPPVETRAPRTGIPPVLLIGGGLVVTAVVVVLGLQFLKPPAPLVTDSVPGATGSVTPADDPKTGELGTGRTRETGTERETRETGRPAEETNGGEPKTTPVEKKPAEKKPAETQPAETKPAETKPKETKPVEKPPVEKPSVTPTENPAEKPKGGGRRYRVSSRPSADITVDGRKIQFGQIVTLAPGVHRFKAVNPTMNLQGEFTYTVTADDTNNALILNLEDNRLVARQVRDLPY